MRKLKITIPNRTSDSFGDPLIHVIQMVGKLNQAVYDSVEFDFSGCKFLRPYTIVGVSVVAHDLVNSGIGVSFIKPNSQSIADYVDIISSPWGMTFPIAENINDLFAPYKDKTFIPLVSFSTAKDEKTNTIREKLLTAIDTLLKNQIGLKGDMFQAVSYLLAEMTQNVVDHSNSEKGLIFAQYYPTKNFLDICIADYGKGLYQSYLDSGKHEPKTDSEAINFAVYGKSTKDLPASRGFGLSTSRKMLVTGLKGKFFLYSGSSFYNQTLANEEIISLPEELSLQGCYVALRIPMVMDQQFSFYDYVE